MSDQNRNIQIKSDYIQEGVDLLISQNQDRYNTTQLLKSNLKLKQELENAIYEATYCLLLDTADSVRLDILGKIVGQERGTFTDETFRLYIKGRIAANRSYGKSSDMINLLNIIDPNAEYSESQPATIRIVSGLEFDDSNNWELANAYLDLILTTKPAGVSYEIQDWSGILELDTYGFTFCVNEDGESVPGWNGSFCDIDDITGEWEATANSGLFINLITP